MDNNTTRMIGLMHQHNQQQHQPPLPPPHEDSGPVDSSNRGTRGACSGRRPASHFCACCNCLMLTSERLPVRLEPCGHVTCSRCAEPNTLVSCPTCKVSAVRGRPDTGLQTEVVNHFYNGNSSNPATSFVTSDSNTHAVKSHSHPAAAPNPMEGHRSRCQRQTHQSNAAHLRNSSDPSRWYQEIEVIGTRMHSLEATLEQLKTEISDLIKKLTEEATRERQLKQLETDTRDKLDRLEEDLRRAINQKAASRENQACVELQQLRSRRRYRACSQHSASCRWN